MSLTQVVASRELLWNLTLRELRTKYRRSFLGWSWSLINPLATVAIYGYVFGTLFGAQAPVGNPSDVQNFALYMLCGLLPWNFFLMVTGGGMGSLIGNAALVRKVAFPREALVFAQVLHGLVQFGIEMALLAVVLLIFGSPLLPMLPFTILMMLLLGAFSAGIALLLASVNVYFRDTAYLWTIVTQIWFYATPIVYPDSMLDDRVSETARQILRLNPFARFIEGFRRTMYDGRAPGLWSTLTLAAIAVVSLTIGWAVFSRLSRRFAEEL